MEKYSTMLLISRFLSTTNDIQLIKLHLFKLFLISVGFGHGVTWMS